MSSRLRAYALDYDRVLIGTGATPVRSPMGGLGAPGVYQLHTMADSFAVHEHLGAKNPRTALVVGGG
jgi:NAD(P)H-nitrite reductase large subunit